MSNGENAVTLAVQLARFVARVVDAVLVAAVSLFSALGFWSLSNEVSDETRASDDVLLYLYWWFIAAAFGLLYEIVAVSWKGQTFGKWVVGVEVSASDVSTPPGFKQSIRRASRQFLLWLVVPLGLVSVWRLVFLERRQAWYDRSSGTAVCWAVPIHSKRMRLWNQLERFGGWPERHPIVIFCAGAGVVFCVFVPPPNMQEATAVKAIELLVTANVVGLGVFVATAGLVVRYNRTIGPSGTASSNLYELAFTLGGVSLGGILAGAGYVATQPPAMHDIEPQRLVTRSLIFIALVAGVAALFALWIVQIEAETEIQNTVGNGGTSDPPNEETGEADEFHI